MDRTIKFSELQNAVNEAYEKFKDFDKGEVDPRVTDADASKFGISVTLTDGRTVKVGDTDTQAPLGGIAKVPTAELLLSQLKDPDEIVEKARGGKCCCAGKKPEKPHIPVSPRGVRAMSAIQPTGDADGKWDMVVNNLINLSESEPTLDDSLYKQLTEQNNQANAVNALAEADFFLYDDAAISIDLYTRLKSMKMSASQLSALSATIAADGFNPITKQTVFDGSISQRVVAMMAVKGPHHMSLPWLIKSGLPAQTSFAGTIMGVLPGVMGIAAYSPKVNPVGISARGAHALAYIMNKLGLSALSSARVSVE